MIIRDDLIFPELCYKIVGCAYEVHNTLGAGHLEKIYQRALATALENKGISFREQVSRDIVFQGKVKGRLDFLVEEKIVIEIKRTSYFNPADFEQLQQYLQLNNLSLGILIRFSTDKVYFKRVVNINRDKEFFAEEEASEYLSKNKSRF